MKGVLHSAFQPAIHKNGSAKTPGELHEPRADVKGRAVKKAVKRVGSSRRKSSGHLVDQPNLKIGCGACTSPVGKPNRIARWA